MKRYIQKYVTIYIYIKKHGHNTTLKTNNTTQ